MGPRHLDRKIVFARAALLWERLWVALWPPLGVAGAFAALALFDLLPALPGWLHVAVLAGFAAAFAAVLWRARAVLAPPSEAAAERRLERVNALDHRPLATLRDRLAAGTGDAGTEALWRLHRRRLLRRLARLRVGLPSPGLPARDPLAVRALLFVVLVVAVAAAGRDAPSRMLRAVTPTIGAGNGAASVALDAWITPPAYTRLAPVFLKPSEPTPVVVPRGSTLVAHVTGGEGRPALRLDAAETAFSAAGGGSHQLSADLRQGERIAIFQDGRELGAWPLSLTDDAPPTIAFAGPPQATARKHVSLAFEAKDDYGLARVRAVVRLTERPQAEALEIELPLADDQPTAARATSYHDLTPHPWAGLDVIVHLEATDAVGQEGRSDEVAFVLPEREFNHPVARAIIAARKKLSQNPDERGPVIGDLDDIASAPQRFRHDVVVYLALRTARARLVHDQSREAVTAVQEMLWLAALRVEDGELSLAERDLKAARDALNRAFERRANDAEIQRLMDRLQRALERYLEALAQALDPREAETLPLDPNMRVVESSEIQRMLDRIRELARTGQLDAARQLLQRLERMLENMRVGRFPQGQQQRMGQAQRMMRGLSDMIRRQQDLLDRSFRRSQGTPSNDPRTGRPMPSPQADALAQRALRQALGEMMMNMAELSGEVPQEMGRAELAMRDAGDAIGAGEHGRAAEAQQEALRQLQEGSQALRQQLANQFGYGMVGGTPEGEIEEESQAGRDPLGRDREGFLGAAEGFDVRVPDEMELKRAREILDELRRRAGQPDRPRQELDYYNRLLERF